MISIWRGRFGEELLLGPSWRMSLTLSSNGLTDGDRTRNIGEGPDVYYLLGAKIDVGSFFSVLKSTLIFKNKLLPNAAL
jgi:hypothetical protein